MTNKQPEACEVPFVEQLESVPNNSRLWVDFPEGMGSTHFPVGHYCHKAAAELRRLHEVNAELLAALDKLARLGNGDRYGNSIGNTIAQEAIAKATGEQQ
jgi:hypothetical protein